MDKKRWQASRAKYLFNAKSLAKAFKHRYIGELQALHGTGKLKFPGKSSQLSCPQAFGKLVTQLKKQDWVVYAKAPFAGPQQVLDYLGRYTHRVAISNHRIESVQNGGVTFTCRDRADNDQLKHMTLDAVEFIRRFLLHVLPYGFVKIRYIGFLAHRNRKQCVALIRKMIDPSGAPVQIRQETVGQMMLRLNGIDIALCPKCAMGKLKRGKPLNKARSIRCRAPTRALIARDKRKIVKIFGSRVESFEAVAWVRLPAEIWLKVEHFISLAIYPEIKMRLPEPENRNFRPHQPEFLTLAKIPTGRYNPHNFKALKTEPKAVKFNTVLSIL